MDITRFDTIDSTNDYIKREKIGEKHIISADVQSAGRGRRGNIWNSSAGGAWFSFCLNEDKNITQEYYGKIPFIAGASVSAVLAEVTGSDIFMFKWVNDIYVYDKKICGILVEKSEGHFIIGIGINVNNNIEAEYRDNRISLYELFGRTFDIEEIIMKTAERFYENYTLLIRGGWPEIYTYICEKDYLRGREIKVINDGCEILGIAEGITTVGSLKVKTKDEIKEVETGSIIIR